MSESSRGPGAGLGAGNTPDLRTMVRIARHRETHAQRNRNISTQLPATWTQLGNLPRAETLAASITDPYRQVEWRR